MSINVKLHRAVTHVRATMLSFILWICNFCNPERLVMSIILIFYAFSRHIGERVISIPSSWSRIRSLAPKPVLGKCIMEAFVGTHWMMSVWTDGFTQKQIIRSLSRLLEVSVWCSSAHYYWSNQSAVSISLSPPVYESQVSCKRRRTTWLQQRMTHRLSFTSCQESFYSDVSFAWLDIPTMRTCFGDSVTDLAVWIPAACSSLSVVFPDCWLIASSSFQQTFCPSLCLSRPLRFYWESEVNPSLDLYCQLLTCERGEQICRFKKCRWCKGTD